MKSRATSSSFPGWKGVVLVTEPSEVVGQSCGLLQAVHRTKDTDRQRGNIHVRDMDGDDSAGGFFRGAKKGLHGDLGGSIAEGATSGTVTPITAGAAHGPSTIDGATDLTSLAAFRTAAGLAIGTGRAAAGKLPTAAAHAVGALCGADIAAFTAIQWVVHEVGAEIVTTLPSGHAYTTIAGLTVITFIIAIRITVGVPIYVSIGVPIYVSVGVPVSVSVCVPVYVSVGVCVSVSVGVCVHVAIRISVDVAVSIAIGICVAVAVSIGVRIDVGVGVAVGVIVVTAGGRPKDRRGHEDRHHESEHLVSSANYSRIIPCRRRSCPIAAI